MRSDGQEWAIVQLEGVARASDYGFEVVEVIEPALEGGEVVVTVSIGCREFLCREGGIPFRRREVLLVDIPWGFPLSRPNASFSHSRYAAFPHVQWGVSICLYQAPDVEWQPADGMFGFMQRLRDWLEAAAAGELDPIGMPLHPPVAYPTSSFSVIATADVPKPDGIYWGGYAEIVRENATMAELGRWIEESDDVPGGRLASAILLPSSMPHEYPASVLMLVLALIERNVPLRLIQLIVTLGVLRTPPGKQAIFLLGADMRGIAGGARLQHLACWRIGAVQADKLREAALQPRPEGASDSDAFYAWAATADVEWCRVIEDRAEIVERRDSRSRSSWWRNRHVAILGCGAIGSTVAMILARAGAGKLELYDKGVLTPGVLVRQNFQRTWIGHTKCSALKVEIEAVDPRIEVAAHHGNLVSLLADADRRVGLMAADLIVDATASNTVSAAFEHHIRRTAEAHPPVVTMILGHDADFGLMTFAPRDAPGLSLDLERRSKVALAASRNHKSFLDEFWPSPGHSGQLFQPEPGCSSPTFRGSFADVLGLTARMTNVAASWLSSAGGGAEALTRAFALDLSDDGLVDGRKRELAMAWRPDAITRDPRHGYQIRLRDEARRTIISWMRRCEKTREDRCETGGVLFGGIDDFLKVIWIDEAIGPPPDSDASPAGFVCGTVGVNEIHEDRKARTKGSVTFVGMWHTHPKGLPFASPIDLGAMQSLLRDEASFGGRRFLMLIVGGTSRLPIVSASVFERGEYRGGGVAAEVGS